MTGIHVTVPIACFRKGLAREYLETEPLPPPSTCYGFLLSLVGESSRQRHVGCRVAPILVGKPSQSVVLRTVWRVKQTPLGSPGNTRPDYQQVLSHTELVVWLDSTEETHAMPTLEDRVRLALTQPQDVRRFGGLSLGESTHLVNDVSLLNERVAARLRNKSAQAFLLSPRGRMTLPVWVDHVGSRNTRHVTGELAPVTDVSQSPAADQMPKIEPFA